ncbi:MAG TPA: oligoribonuclease [Candidatus Saccharimonadales bacterium]|nr:oligoribonuclease [Candidatus Saccharimonadales bacterium]
MGINKNAAATKLLWVDLEMTGLDVANDRIIEVACEVTDFAFKTLASYEAIIMQTDDVLDNMNDWSRVQHQASGLTDRIKREGRDEKTVVHELVGFIKAQFGSEPAILAGNSIHNDRDFIKKHWPEVEALLHYRMLDVSSFKILMQSKYNIKFAKKEVHRAFDDIQASIAELQYYIESFKKLD